MLLFKQILDSAKKYNLPANNPEMTLVQYLQCEILDSLYKLAPNLHFIGGTCLCIFHGLPRFSEDLDFDNFDLKQDDFKKLIQKLDYDLKLKGFDIEFRVAFKGAYHCYFKFNKLLYDNKLSPYKNQKILIRLDTTRQKIKVKKEIKIMQRFGLSREILSNPIETIMSQKIVALLERKRAKGRDFFDFLWLRTLTNPDFGYLRSFANIKNEEELNKAIQARIKNLDFKKLARDVEKFLFNRQDLEKMVNFKKYSNYTAKNKI
ncbi:MAG: nucleotidyl transferase AbiEii/AbiGii toxin family protein [Patescibacteria group bacterium]